MHGAKEHGAYLPHRTVAVDTAVPSVDIHTCIDDARLLHNNEGEHAQKGSRE